MIDKLLKKSKSFYKKNNLPYKRYFIQKEKLNHKLSIILGARGIGKTTTIAQYMHNYKENEALYISLDDTDIDKNFTMLDLADEFSKRGGKLLCFDEIHKYDSYSGELKNIYDTYDLKVIASGSDALKIEKGTHDLSRRAVKYKMFGMSFREFLEIKYKYELPTLCLDEILKNHINIAIDMGDKVEDIIKLFKEYLKSGYYPYCLSFDDIDDFFTTLKQSLNTTIDIDLVNIYPSLNGHTCKKLKEILYFIIQSVPFSPNLTKIKTIADIADDRTLKDYLSKLEDASLIKFLQANPNKLNNLNKQKKLYMENTNLMYIKEPEIGNIRETFFLNQLSNYYEISKSDKGIFTSKKGDFYLENKYTFEIGGQNKSFNQIKDIENSFLALDDTEIGHKNKIPLWLFGFLY